MLEKLKVLIVALILLVISFTVGRYTSRAPDTTAKSDTLENKVVDKDTHTKTVVVETTKPDGEKQKVTTVITDTSTVATDVKDIKTETTSLSKKPIISVSVLAGLDYKTRIPTYGIAVSKEFIGPITIGAFGLTDGIIGVTVGLNF